MDNIKHLTTELRAAREELTRRERHHGQPVEGGVTPAVEPHFRRLRTLSVDELHDHIERLERDIADFSAGMEAWDAPTTATGTESD